MRQRGITPVFSILLLLGVLVVLVGMFLLFFTDLFSNTGKRVGNETDKKLCQTYEDFSIESIDVNRVYIRNKGSCELSDLSFYINGDAVDVSQATIQPDSIGCYLLDSASLSGLVSIEVKSVVKERSAQKDYTGVTEFYDSC